MKCLQSRSCGRLRKRFRGCALPHDRVHHGITKRLPFVEAAQQRTHMANAVLSQLQRRTGAGRFVWSSTEKHDFAVASDLAVPAFEFFGRDLDCSGEGAGVAQYIERMTKVNDDDWLAGFEFVLQFIGSDTVPF